VASIKTDFQEEFRDGFKDYEQLAETSLRIYMQDQFKGEVKPSGPGDLCEKTELQVRAEELLLYSIDELKAEESKANKKPRRGGLAQVALGVESSFADSVVDTTGSAEYQLDGRLVLKDKALKEADLDLYHQIDKLKPDAVDYLIRK
jgi:hypothetical protein